MALKDWKKIREGKYSITWFNKTASEGKQYISVHQELTGTQITNALGKVEKDFGKLYSVSTPQDPQGFFSRYKSKLQALKFVKEYMRTH